MTDSPHRLNRRTTSLAYRRLSAIPGSLGIGADITKWSLEESTLARRPIAAYHEVHTTIVQDDPNRLISLRNDRQFSAQAAGRSPRGGERCVVDFAAAVFRLDRP